MIVECRINGCDGSYDTEIYPHYHRGNPHRLCRECYRKTISGEFVVEYGWESHTPIEDRFEILDFSF